MRWLVSAGLLFGLVFAACGGSDNPMQVSNEPATGEGQAGQQSGGSDSSGSALKVVVLDPGHGGPEIGAAANGLEEKNSNLDMAFRVKELLEQRGGIRVVLTRTEDSRAIGTPADLWGYDAERSDLQARTDLANRELADVFVSIHSNGSSSPGNRGVEVWWDSLRPFADKNKKLAQLLQDSVMQELTGHGYDVVDRGIKDDACWQQRADRCFQIFVLAPEREQTREEIVRRGGDPERLGFAPDQHSMATRPALMPSALVELLFITDEQDAAVLKDDTARDAMARGVARGILEFLDMTTYES